MSAVSVLRKKSTLPDASVNEFAALGILDPEAWPPKTTSRRIHTEDELQRDQADEEQAGSVSWIRDNIRVARTQRGPKVTWTPWKNGSELSMIRDWIFPQCAVLDPYSSPVEDLRKEAVNVVSRWDEQNKDLELPHSILATASLTDAMLHDTQPTSERIKHISNQALQSIYAMAFCRFVNGFVDRDVAKASLTAMATTTIIDKDGLTTSTSRGESSMYALASKIGMPLHFVEMRHQITHETMPSIEELAKITEEALVWMYERWWKMNVSFDPTAAWTKWRTSEEQRPMGLVDTS